jgi:uncharacterized protein YcnI/copper(I)-binding protein
MHMKIFAGPALATAALVLSTSLSFAHATIAPTQASNGSAVRAVITIPHGCDGKPTTALSVKIPEGFVAAKPMPKAGWQLAISKGDYAKAYKVYGEAVKSGAIDIAWTGGNLPDDEFDEFIIQGNIQGFDAPTRLVFPITQTCGDVTVNWTDVPAAGQSAHGLKHPAPGIDVTLAPAVDAMAGMDMSSAAPAPADVSAPVTVGDLKISSAFSRAMLPGQPTGGGYFTITNSGTQADRLVSASSSVAGAVSLHSMTMDGNVMQMRPVPDGIEIPAGGTVTLDPNGLHLMFEKVTAPFKAGDVVPVTLTFAKAGKVELALKVGAIGAKGP